MENISNSDTDHSGALGAVAQLTEYMGMLDIQKKEVDRVQFSALLGSVRILRRVLDISG